MSVRGFVLIVDSYAQNKNKLIPSLSKSRVTLLVVRRYAAYAVNASALPAMLLNAVSGTLRMYQHQDVTTAAAPTSCYIRSDRLDSNQLWMQFLCSLKAQGTDS